jgi:hypothetical protein
MGKQYDCHKQKYYVPQNKPAWSILNLKQASKKVSKEKSVAQKQNLSKKKQTAEKLANRKGGRGVRNPANPDFKANLQKVTTPPRKKDLSAAQPPEPQPPPFVLFSRSRRSLSSLRRRVARHTKGSSAPRREPRFYALRMRAEPSVCGACFASTACDAAARQPPPSVTFFSSSPLS